MTDSIQRAIRNLIFLIFLLLFASMAIAMRPPGPLEIGGILMILGGALIGIPIYFLPAIIASARHCDNKLVVFLINLFFGWSLIGWVIALIFAFSKVTKKSEPDQTVVVSQNIGNQNKQYRYLNIAKERYVKGEISKEEFEQIKKDLT